MIGPNLTERLASLAIAAAIHAIFGWALFHVVDHGAPLAREVAHGDGAPLIVELIPLEKFADRLPLTPPPASPLNQMVRPTVVPQSMPALEGAANAAPRAAANSTGVSRDAAVDNEEASAAPAMAELPVDQARAWRALLQAHLARYRLYPQVAASEGRQGVVLLHFVANSDGRVEDAWIEASSGVSEIDRETVAAILRAQPLPPFPGGWPDKLDVRLPVSFQLG